MLHLMLLIMASPCAANANTGYNLYEDSYLRELICDPRGLIADDPNYRDYLARLLDSQECEQPTIFTKLEIWLGKICTLDIFARSKTGKELLHFAAECNPGIIPLLLTKGAHVNVSDNDGNQPLHIAAHHNHGKASTDLICAGADVKAKNERGDTPLHIAVRDLDKRSVVLKLLRFILQYDGYKEAKEVIIKQLVLAGAFMMAENSNGETPITIVKDQDYQDLAQWMEKNKTWQETAKQKIWPIILTGLGSLAPFLGRHLIEDLICPQPKKSFLCSISGWSCPLESSLACKVLKPLVAK